MHLKEKMISAAEVAMAGRKCNCPGCNCHYGKEDAEKLVAALAPIIVKECTIAAQHAVHDDLLAKLS